MNINEVYAEQKAAVRKLADLTGIPESWREKSGNSSLNLGGFYSAAHELIDNVNEFTVPPGILNPAFLEAEKKVRDAKLAIDRLDERQRREIHAAGSNPDVLSQMVEAFAQLTGKQPLPQRRHRGQPKGIKKDRGFRWFIMELDKIVTDHRGELSFSAKKNSAFFKILGVVMPLVPFTVPRSLKSTEKDLSKTRMARKHALINS